MSSLRRLVKDWLPPIVLRYLCRLRGHGNAFKGEFRSWEHAASECSGYDATLILDKVLGATLSVRRGEAAFERDSVLFEEFEYAWLPIAGLMWAAAQNNGKLNVLDFGGALGSSYFQNRAFLDTLTDLKWNVVEQAHYVQEGRSAIQDDRLRFYSSISDCLQENKPNLVMFSSVLQYLSDPNSILNEVLACGAPVLIIDRTPFSNHADEHIVIQKVPKQIYDASYPMRIFSWEKFCAALERHWQIIAIDLSPEGYVETDRGISFCFKGMLLHSKK